VAQHDQPGAAEGRGEQQAQPRIERLAAAQQRPRRHQHGRQAQRNQRRDRRADALDAEKPAEHVQRHAAARAEHRQPLSAQRRPERGPAEDGEQHHRADDETPERDRLRPKAVAMDQQVDDQRAGAPEKPGEARRSHRRAGATERTRAQCRRIMLRQARQRRP
jgi:hypothetical protein